ncbi:MAG: hypothetical protein RB288_03500 [Bacteroidales bacterium]|jgi:hypothetical protein|nr:hypothetical protein [Bacteroidales bacterium]
MCFSAGASFAGGAIITTIGVLTVSRNRVPSRRLFASMPLIFGVQQISEGFVWVALQSSGHNLMLSISAFIFLLAAVVIWPVMVPLSVYLMEGVQSMKRVLLIFIGVGLLTSLYYGSRLLFYDIEPMISHHHIKYVGDFPRTYATPAFIAYLVATLIPLFLSSVRRMWLLGILMTLSCLVTGIFFKEYLTSVWCFFAAVISIVILWIIVEDKRLEKITAAA